ncbi:ATPase [Altererythrobacter sp. KTW20L]|uniref:ATPase n=1 Tax=Altererythrobacter sp. KTW20L TaxID=2942210 RepID=UPI0020BECF49|nr:ATPase [Altererythrobacter sp. KTW20L]MCL6251926.1 ATPase [Altererythrobacter sp. KTW20L]
MTRRKNLVALGSPGGEGHDHEEGTQNVTQTQSHVEAQGEAGHAFAQDWEDEEEQPRHRAAFALPAIAIMAIVGWTGFFGWAMQREIMADGTPQQWIGWIGSWSLPVLLVVALWLLAMRNSAREAARFGDAARLLSAESIALEQRLSVVNRELSLARDFIADQSRDLESLGRLAAERLSQNAAELQQLIIDNSAQVSTIGSVSDSAVANMDRLRDQMPVISNSARDLANRIGNVGHSAQCQLDAMVAAFQRLNEFGEVSEKQVEALRVRVGAILDDFDSHLARLRDEGDSLTASLSEGHDNARNRWEEAIAGFQQNMADAITRVSQLDEAAIGNARKRMDALHEAGSRVDQSIIDSANAFEAEVARRREQAAEAEAEALAALQSRLAAFDEQSRERQEAHLAHLAAVAERGDQLAQRIAAFDADMSRLAGQGREEGERLGETVEMLAEKLSQSRVIMEESGIFVSRLTNDSVRLLEIIRASSDHSEGALSDSIGKAEARLAQFETRANALRETIAEAESRGGMLAEHVNQATDQSAASLETLSSLEARLAAIAEQASALALQAQEELQSALGLLEQASTEAVGKLRAEQAEAVGDIARSIGSDASKTIEAALRDNTREAIDELEEAARNAGERGRDAAAQLRDQLAKVNQLAGNLESRVAQARTRAEEQVNNDFTRRMALITESLNSSSIDIARALDAEVTDTSWASYLRGDRGIFTRRAVRLLDNAEARAVSEVYEQDPEVREAINRYIHDFEAMLRTILSTRDGNALAVTILSSDIGKLYVAMAQAIERLRD